MCDLVEKDCNDITVPLIKNCLKKKNVSFKSNAKKQELCDLLIKAIGPLSWKQSLEKKWKKRKRNKSRRKSRRKSQSSGHWSGGSSGGDISLFEIFMWLEIFQAFA